MLLKRQDALPVALIVRVFEILCVIGRSEGTGVNKSPESRIGNQPRVTLTVNVDQFPSQPDFSPLVA